MAIEEQKMKPHIKFKYNKFFQMNILNEYFLNKYF